MALTFSKKLISSVLPLDGGATQPANSPTPGGRALKPKPRPLIHLADRVFGKVLAITPEKADIIVNVLWPRAGTVAAAYDLEDDNEQDAGYDIQNGIACIPVRGTLVKRSMGLNAFSGLSSYEDLSEQIIGALTDPNVKAVLLDVDSPGGEVDGMFDLADMIYSQRGQKPIVAVCNDQMCSAAYAIASSADQIYVTRTGMVGSIGCFMLHCDQSGADEQAGKKYTYIFDGARKVDGNPHSPLSAEALATMQGEVSRIKDMFVTMVARNRNVTAQQVIDTQSGAFFAEDAIPLLADKLGTCDAAMDDLMTRLSIDPDNDDQECDPNDPEDDPCNGQLSNLSQGDKTDAVRAFPGIMAAAIPPHKTATSDQAWDGPENEARLKLNQPGSYYRKAYAWVDSKGDETKKASYKFIHHDVDANGNIGAANLQGCRSGIAVLNGARGGTTIPTADRKGVYNHLAKHLRDAGVKPAPFKSEGAVPILESNEYPDAALEMEASEHLTGLLAIAKTGWADHFYSDIESMSRFGRAGVTLALRRFSECGHAEATAPSLDGRRISMLAVPYDNSSANLGSFREIYQPGCFSRGLDNDPRATFNHDEGCILGRKSAGTARFWEDAAGVHVEADAPKTTWADDLLESMRRKDITQSSAAFWILQQRWEMRGGEKYRIVEKALLREAAVHSFPAYESTQAGVQPASAVAAHATELAKARLRLLRAASR